MKLLIDTHVWLWMLNKPTRIGLKTRRVLDNSRNEIFLSPMSIWEVVLIARDGRLGKSTDPYQWFERAFAEFPLHEAPLTREIALEMGRFELRHGDPADRWLIATARVMACKLVTEDEKIIHSKCVETISSD